MQTVKLIDSLDYYDTNLTRQSKRACRLRFTDSKPFRLL